MRLPKPVRMSKSKLPDHLIALAVLVCVVAGCKQLQSLAKPKVLKSPDGNFQLTVPGGWQENASLNDKAAIKAANLLEEMYVIVITEPKTDFTSDMTLDEFTRVTRDSIMSNIADSAADDPRSVTVNGNSARTYELQGAVKNVKLAYLITTVETPDHYHQVISWTLQSRKDKNRANLQKVIDSFRPATEVGTDAPSK